MTYTAQYPPAHTVTYVKASSTYSSYYSYLATDPALSLTGTAPSKSWMGKVYGIKFSVDYGTPYIMRRLYIENGHDTGGGTLYGIKNIIVYGTNSATAFASTTYSDLTDLAAVGSFEVQQHAAVDASDPQYFLLTNDTAYRYYVIRIADNWYGNQYPQIRHLEFQTEDGGGSTTLIRNYVDLPYSIIADNIRTFVDMLYSILYQRISFVDMLYSLRLAAYLKMYYGDCPEVRAKINMFYGDCPLLRRKLAMPYDELTLHQAVVDMPYSLPRLLTAAMEMRYSIAEAELRGFVDMGYDILSVNLLRKIIDMPYLMAGDGVVTQIDQAVTIAGRTVKCSHINIEPDWSLYAIPAEIHLISERDYLETAIGDELVIVLQGVTYNLIVDNKREGMPERGSVAFIVTGLSPAVLLTEDFSRPLLTSYGASTAEALINELVGDLGPVTFNIDDYPIAADTLFANDEAGIEVIRKIIAPVMACIQSDPDGTIRIEYQEPPDWQNRTPDYYLSYGRNFVSQNQDHIKKPGYNKYLIGNQLTAEDRIWAEQQAISKRIVNVLGFQTPWDDDVELVLEHSGGAWVGPIEYLGVVEETYPAATDPAEQVEFVAGYATASRPIYGDLEIEWIREQLGSITYAEDGRLEAEVKDGDTDGYSLAEIRYTTRYHLWRVTNERNEDVQFMLRRLDDEG